MIGMSIQERYDEIAKISGLSEDIIRRVYKATRQSIAKSLKRGERSTIPGICTFTPEVREKINYNAETEEDVLRKYIKVKATTSPALETELAKVSEFVSDDTEKAKLDKENLGLNRLNLTDNPEIPRYTRTPSKIITTQINALL